jgi:hypothetical protein
VSAIDPRNRLNYYSEISATDYERAKQVLLKVVSVFISV